MGDIYAGLGGLFGGLDRGLQMLLNLRHTLENQRIAQERTDLDRQTEGRIAGQQALENQQMPYLNQQKQLNEQGVTAGYGDVVREYEGPRMENFLPEAEGFQAPRFGSSGLGLEPPGQGGLAPSPADIGASSVQESLRGADAALGRSRRQAGQLQDNAGYEKRTGTLTDVLNEASRRAQTSQLPVSGRFKTETGEEATLPAGFTAGPRETFSPYQLSPRAGSDPLDDLFKPLLNDPVKQLVLKETNPAMYAQFEAWAAARGIRISGGGVNPPPPSGGDPDDPQPGEPADAYARRVGRKLGGSEARRRYQRANPGWRP